MYYNILLNSVWNNRQTVSKVTASCYFEPFMYTESFSYVKLVSIKKLNLLNNSNKIIKNLYSDALIKKI